MATIRCVRAAAKPTSSTALVPLRGVEHGAAAAIAMRIDEFANPRVEVRLPQRLDHQAALPLAVMGLRPNAARRSPRRSRNEDRWRDARGARFDH